MISFDDFMNGLTDMAEDIKKFGLNPSDLMVTMRFATENGWATKSIHSFGIAQEEGRTLFILNDIDVTEISEGEIEKYGLSEPIKYDS